MENLLFSNGFAFNTFSVSNYKYTDNRKGCEYNYIGFMQKGRAVIESTDIKLEIKEGDYFYIPINCSYRSYWYGEPEIQFDSFGFKYFPNPLNKKYALQRLILDNDALQLYGQLKTERDHTCRNIGIFYTLFGMLTENMLESYTNRQEATAEKAYSYMSRNDGYKISDVARYCGVSESGLYKIFRQHYGCTPVDIKHKIMVENAILLLNSTDYSVEEVAEKCGFCSAIYFRKILKKVTGKNPSQMRKLILP